MQLDNKNPKQIKFAEIKGTISEMNDSEMYCSITLTCGHENPRSVNLSVRKVEFDKFKNKYSKGDRVKCTYFPTSNNKREKWFTSLILLSLNFDIPTK